MSTVEHRCFRDIVDYLRPGDVVVLNDTRVIPARLRGRKETVRSADSAGHSPSGGGKVEVLLLHREASPGGAASWRALVRPGKRLEVGTRLTLGQNGHTVSALVAERGEDGSRLLTFADESCLAQAGEVPLPPYIHTPLDDPERYQTVYARAPGSAAAPTAGLHFTPELLQVLGQKGVGILYVTLHIGLDTFRPVREADPHRHTIHREWAQLSPEAAAVLNRARAGGGRVIATGTTSVRVLEECCRGGRFEPYSGWCGLFILPGRRFRGVDVLLTNFHLPRSTTLMLTAAFAGRERLLAAYREAIHLGYRFYSFGDCLLIL
jgi:S-adenosylmethionine:tRNA ribosyltransferase-isomerase